ncbi:hypothetical protein ACUSIJ_12120 [Pseudochelatococcus sp. B33]
MLQLKETILEEVFFANGERFQENRSPEPLNRNGAGFGINSMLDKEMEWQPRFPVLHSMRPWLKHAPFPILSLQPPVDGRENPSTAALLFIIRPVCPISA